MRLTTKITAACGGLLLMLAAHPAQAQLGLSRVELFALQQEMRDRDCGNQHAGGLVTAETQRAIQECARRLGVAPNAREVLHALDIGFGPGEFRRGTELAGTEPAPAAAPPAPTAVMPAAPTAPATTAQPLQPVAPAETVTSPLPGTPEGVAAGELAPEETTGPRPIGGALVPDHEEHGDEPLADMLGPDRERDPDQSAGTEAER